MKPSIPSLTGGNLPAAVASRLARNQRDGTSDTAAADAVLMKMLMAMAYSAFVRVFMRVERVEMSIALLDATEFP